MSIWFTATAVLVVVALVFVTLAHLGRHRRLKKHQGFMRRATHAMTASTLPTSRTRRKPQWVMLEVLRLKALMGKSAGCRKVADTFNRLHTPSSIGKSYVSDTIKNHQYMLLRITRQLRENRPRPVQVNGVWGIDLTFVRDYHGNQHTVLGAIDHGSRLCTQLVTVLNKRSWTLIGHLCLAIGQHGKPGAIRTDNEAVFNSVVFRSFLKLLGIHKQTIPISAPWCNGRIEIFFGRIKPVLKQLDIYSVVGLQNALDEIRNFFNHIRPHQNLNGLTPAESWRGFVPTDIYRTPPKSATLVQALDGLLVGYHIRS